MYGRGDKVICIKDNNMRNFHRPELNKEYTVLKISRGGTVQLEEFYGTWFGMKRFATEEDIIRMEHEEQLKIRQDKINKILKVKENVK